MAVKCNLCPKTCIIRPGESGECKIRVNIADKLCSVTYGFPCAVHTDPVEKKPLFHFLPGTGILSLATAGCNLHCKNCQNWEISQADPAEIPAYELLPGALPDFARQSHCPSVAYTYTEPLIYYEYTLDCCRTIRAAGLKNVLVTAGYLNPAPFKELLPLVDAANIDLKALSDKFYREICSATLKPVLDNLILAQKAGVLVEVTNLLIPTLNDDDAAIAALCQWIVTYMGRDTPLHFSRFFPRYQLQHLPPTPEAVLLKARQLALAAGLRYVYLGNIMLEDGENTFCPYCNRLLIRRSGYTIVDNQIVKNRCRYCQREVYGIWE